MRIGPSVGMRMTCHLERETHVNLIVYASWTDHYAVQTVWVDRPAAGFRAGAVRCAACDAIVGFRVYSRAATRMRKYLYLAGGLLTAVGAALMAWNWEPLRDSVADSSARAYFPGLPFAVLGFVSLLLLVAAPSQDGVSRDDTIARGWGRHRFRRLGEFAAPAPADDPPHPKLYFGPDELPSRPVSPDQLVPTEQTRANRDNPAVVLGPAPGTVIREFGWHAGVDEELRFGIEELTGTDLVDAEDGPEHVECVLLWWRPAKTGTEPADLLARARAAITPTGVVWLLTRGGGPEAGDPADITEAAMRAGLSRIDTVSVRGWTGYLLRPTESIIDPLY